MQKKQSGSVRVSYRQRDEVEITSKDLTRTQLLSYIFEDFFRISYGVAALFFDALILPELYLLRPAGDLYYGVAKLPAFRSAFYGYYLIAVVAILEVCLIYLEAKGYRRLWPREKIIVLKKKVRGQ